MYLLVVSADVTFLHQVRFSLVLLGMFTSDNYIGSCSLWYSKTPAVVKAVLGHILFQ